MLRMSFCEKVRHATRECGNAEKCGGVTDSISIPITVYRLALSHSTCRFSQLLLLTSCRQILLRISRARFRFSTVLLLCSFDNSLLLLPWRRSFLSRLSLRRICFSTPTRSSSTLWFSPLVVSINLHSREVANCLPSLTDRRHQDWSSSHARRIDYAFDNWSLLLVLKRSSKIENQNKWISWEYNAGIICVSLFSISNNHGNSASIFSLSSRADDLFPLNYIPHLLRIGGRQGRRRDTRSSHPHAYWSLIAAYYRSRRSFGSWRDQTCCRRRWPFVPECNVLATNSSVSLRPSGSWNARRSSTRRCRRAARTSTRSFQPEESIRRIFLFSHNCEERRRIHRDIVASAEWLCTRAHIYTQISRMSLHIQYVSC